MSSTYQRYINASRFYLPPDGGWPERDRSHDGDGFPRCEDCHEPYDEDEADERYDGLCIYCAGDVHRAERYTERY